MYSEAKIKDSFLFFKACFSNQLARTLPSLYVKFTKQTGRGGKTESAKQICDYFKACFKDYFIQLEIDIKDANEYLRGKKILEFGPGNILGVALLMHAYGAERIHCLDRFPLQKMTESNLKVYHLIIASLNTRQRHRANSSFNKYGEPNSGFNPEKIAYFVTPNGLIEKKEKYDLIISRAVLEHVNDLEKTFFNIAEALKKEGISVHQVDLKSHGLDRYKDFDFLTWPSPIYNLMFSHKGFPNRWRIDKYKELVSKTGLRCKKLIPTGKLEDEKIKFIQPKLANSFRHLSINELSWLGFWIILEHA